jgi:ribonuclease P protein component
MSLRTLISRGDIDTLFRHGRRSSSRLLVILASPTPGSGDPRGRVVFIAGKKLGGAVVRNRCKRVMREMVRRAAGPWPGKDIAVIARPGTRSASPAELDGDLQAGLRGAGVVS